MNKLLFLFSFLFIVSFSSAQALPNYVSGTIEGEGEVLSCISELELQSINIESEEYLILCAGDIGTMGIFEVDGVQVSEFVFGSELTPLTVDLVIPKTINHKSRSSSSKKSSSNSLSLQQFDSYAFIEGLSEIKNMSVEEKVIVSSGSGQPQSSNSISLDEGSERGFNFEPNETVGLFNESKGVDEIIIESSLKDTIKSFFAKIWDWVIFW